MKRTVLILGALALLAGCERETRERPFDGLRYSIEQADAERGGDDAGPFADLDRGTGGLR